MQYFFLVLLFAAAVFYCYRETHTLSVSEYTIVNERIPEAFSGYKIIHISDLHNTRNKAIISQITKVLTDEKPDMIALTGDLVDSHKTDWEQAKELADLIKRFAPVYFVSGNHEERLLSKDSDALEKLNELGFIILQNKAEILKKDDQHIQLAGIDDPRRSGRSTGSLTKEFIMIELNNLTVNRDLFTILLSHRPEFLDLYAEKKVDLVLTGHAHGAQFILPGIGGVYAPNQGLFPKLYQGLHVKDRTTEIISRGTGGMEFPIRINNKFEIAVITLKNKA